jgi:aminoglycoside phosphotransferase
MPTGDAPHGEHDHSTTEPAIREILASLGLSSSGLRWIESYSHSAWMTDDAVVRYRIIGPTGRLLHEAKVAALLPREALYPAVIATGCSGHNDWLVTARVPGESLLAAWPRLSVAQRETATREVASAASALHAAPAQHLQPPCLFGGAPVIERRDFIDTLADVARRAPDPDGRDLHRVLGLLDRYRAFVDDGPKVMAHHDLNFGQCIWRGGHVVGLVDLEMAHANSADWDLTDLLGMCADPGRGAPSDTDRFVHAADFTHVPVWFKEAYTEPFAHPALKERLRVYELVYRLAELTQRPDLAEMRAILENGTVYEHLLPE